MTKGTEPGYPYLVKLLRRDAAVYEDAGEGRLLFEEVLCVFQPEETFFLVYLGVAVAGQVCP
jgi:hypothetical protein